MDLTQYQFFSKTLAEICSRTALVPERPLRWVIIANPTAGGFTMRSRWKRHLAALEKCCMAAQANPLRENCAAASIATDFTADSALAGSALASSGMILTEGPGFAAKITLAVIKEAASGDPKTAPFYLIITAGGDGTSLEVLSVLYHAPESIRSNMAVLRLPMGTGNDGADSPELAGALELLIKPSQVEFAPVLRLLTAPGGPAAAKTPFLAFNILSVGLDAFVTHMTNKMKGKLPGDSYKLWVDIASLLYDRLYTVDFMDVRALDEQGNEVASFREKLLLLAMGISGRRTYGAQKKILPDERNVCGIKQMPLLRKLVLKELFSKGTHVSKPEAIPFSAHRVEVSFPYPLLAQMDGEAVLLEKTDFPAAIELTEKVIPVLKLV
jgi:diacylglycerol kinase family enzyme